MTQQTDAVLDGSYSRFQTTVLVLLRILIGWHFFYEGLAKLTNPYWTSAGYLAESQGWFSGLFLSLSANPTLLAMVDFINSWGLVLIGLGIMLGAFTKVCAIAAAILLFLYYVAAPPLVGYAYSIPAEGSYLIVNKVLIELVAVLVLVTFPTSMSYGLDRLIFRKKSQESQILKRATA